MRLFQISNRGCPKEIRSDNSPTFTETEKEIRPVSFRMGSRRDNITWEMLIRNVSKTMMAILRVPNALTSLVILHRVFAEVLPPLQPYHRSKQRRSKWLRISYSGPLFASMTDQRDCSNMKIFTEGSIGEEHSFWPVTFGKDSSTNSFKLCKKVANGYARRAN